MLIERRPIAVRTLTTRVDNEAYDGLESLSGCLNSPRSVLMRLAIFDLIKKQKRVQARTLEELMQHEAE